MARKLRVMAFSKGNDPFNFFQYLQEKRWYGWVTIDEEKVPRGCVMQHNCLGSTDWKSKWNGMPGVYWFKAK